MSYSVELIAINGDESVVLLTKDIVKARDRFTALSNALEAFDNFGADIKYNEVSIKKGAELLQYYALEEYPL